MEQRPLLSGRGWRLAGWLVTTLFLILGSYTLWILLKTLFGGGA